MSNQRPVPGGRAELNGWAWQNGETRVLPAFSGSLTEHKKHYRTLARCRAGSESLENRVSSRPGNRTNFARNQPQRRRPFRAQIARPPRGVFLRPARARRGPRAGRQRRRLFSSGAAARRGRFPARRRGVSSRRRRKNRERKIVRRRAAEEASPGAEIGGAEKRRLGQRFRIGPSGARSKRAPWLWILAAGREIAIVGGAWRGVFVEAMW